MSKFFKKATGIEKDPDLYRICRNNVQFVESLNSIEVLNIDCREFNYYNFADVIFIDPLWLEDCFYSFKNPKIFEWISTI